MEQAITLSQVQETIRQLRDRGEKVSRRNVLAITGGSMSTIHRLMSQAEDEDAHRSAAVAGEISGPLLAALRTEFQRQVQQATDSLQEKIQLLQEREKETLEALVNLEKQREALHAEHTAQKQRAEQERNYAEKTQAVSASLIEWLERSLLEVQFERRQLQDALEAARIDVATSQLSAEQSRQTADKAELKTERLVTELHSCRTELAEAEKNAAVARLKASNLREVLSRLDGPLPTDGENQGQGAPSDD